jgi:putative tryptophan/tyrosine transport system substrate-binding protein
MQRRTFILLAGSAAGWPFAALAQHRAVPVVGFIDSSSPEVFVREVAAFRKGLAEVGFSEGPDVKIEYRWAEGRYERLPALAAELVDIPVAVIAATGVTAALASQKATASIPVVFHTGGDPVKFGLVGSLSHPGANITGVVSLGKILIPKQFELLHELVPNADPIAFLVNPKNGVVKSDTDSMREAARVKGVRLEIVEAANDSEIDAVVAAAVERHARALVVEVDPFLDGKREKLAALAARHAMPAVGSHPEFAASGGLVSYGNSLPEAYRLEGQYVGRILKGKMPANMPVQQSVKVEMVINLKTAKALGLTVPQSLLARADEGIE